MNKQTKVFLGRPDSRQSNLTWKTSHSLRSGLILNHSVRFVGTMARKKSDSQSKNESEESKPTKYSSMSNERMMKIQALSSLEINPKSKGIWLLITAGFTWKETARILHVGEATIRDVLAGKEIEEKND